MVVQRAGRLVIASAVLAMGGVLALVQAPAHSASSVQRSAADPWSDPAFRRDDQLLGYEHALEHFEERVSEASEDFTTPRKASLAPGPHSAQATGTPDQIGQWSAPFVPDEGDAVGVHAILLHTGKVLLLGNPTAEYGDNALAYLWDPATGEGEEVNPPANQWCSGHAILPDGRVLVVGGTVKSPVGLLGIPAVSIFDPVTETWDPQTPMAHGRWYPTVTTLPDGRALITGGRDETSLAGRNTAIEVFTEGDAPGSGVLQQVGVDPKANLYPRQYVLPNGTVLFFFSRLTRDLDTSTWTFTQWKFTKVAHNAGPGTAMLPAGPAGSWKLLVAGGTPAGSQEAGTSVEIFDASQPDKGWRLGAPLPDSRQHLNLVLLPDGTVLGVGGNTTGLHDGPRYAALLYHPTDNKWQVMASQAERRAYHGTALLLPDGRVLSAGDNYAGGGRRYLELYSPPYLFKGNRPVITSAPDEAASGGTISVTTDGPISRAVLMAPGATTHDVDMNERLVTLTVRPTADGFDADVPGPDIAIPGWYMLTTVNAAGVPSVGHWIHVSAS